MIKYRNGWHCHNSRPVKLSALLMQYNDIHNWYKNPWHRYRNRVAADNPREDVPKG